MTQKYTPEEKEKILDEILEAFDAEERRHIRRLKIIRIQGYIMRGAIIVVVLLPVLFPLFVWAKDHLP